MGFLVALLGNADSSVHLQSLLQRTNQNQIIYRIYGNKKCQQLRGFFFLKTVDGRKNDKTMASG